MKLNKIVSLALAGVLATSMLAGCNDKGASSEVEVPTNTASVVDTFNKELKDELDGNDVQITFTYGSDMEKKAETVMQVNGGDVADADTLVDGVKAMLNIDDDDYLDSTAGATVNNFYGSKLHQAAMAKGAQTIVVVAEATDNLTEKQLMKEAVSELTSNGSWANLVTEKDDVNGIDYTFKYEGELALVEGEDNGTVTTYVIMMVTCTTTTALAD